MKLRPSKARVVFLAALGLGLAQIIACSVDGVTPDCTNASVCAPSLDSGSGEASLLPEASIEAAAGDASHPDGSASDADANADAD